MSRDVSDSFLPVKWRGNCVGYSLQLNGILFFFGNRHVNENCLSEIYPQLSWCRMRQMHSNVVTKVSPPVFADPTADAIWTNAKNLGLIVSTADCLPILIATQSGIAAIHAVWRGVLSGITSRTLQELYEDSDNSKKFGAALIGPHIEQTSFDFSRSDAQPFFDLALRLKLNSDLVVANGNANSTKVRVALRSFVHAQITQTGYISAQDILELPINTFTAPEFHSYRREKEPGRNLSFVARL